MDIILGSARIDERGKASGGTVGDQKQTSTPDYTGEVSMEKFYVHKLGWVILRAKNTEVARKIALAMWQACNNANIGYDQSNRLGVVKYGTGSTVKTECDCSSLVRQCVKEAAGVDAGNFTTGNEKTCLLNTGLFNEVAYTNTSCLREGDILVTKTKGHTGVIVNAPTAANGDTASGTPDVVYRAYCNGKWQDEVKNLEDYAGIENKPISGFMACIANKNVSYRVSTKGKGYLGWVSGYSVSNKENGYAGILGKSIDRLQMKFEGGHIMYRVSVVGSKGYLPWVTDTSDYAGLKNKEIDKIQVYAK